ncbi:MAG: hypothetical protein NVSMB46_05500 [Candidatus Saccharimonadales bacterium]
MLGFPGSGKTTTAQVVSSLTGAIHIWADKERQHMFTRPTHSHSENMELYEALNNQVEELLKEGKSVIFDTNFNFYEDRQKLREIANTYDVHTVILWVQTAKSLAHVRATTDAHLQSTRVLGNMGDVDFERISRKLELPRSNEECIHIDGTKVTEEYIKKILKL